MLNEIANLDRIHVVDKDGPMDLVPFHAQIASVVTDNDVMA